MSRTTIARAVVDEAGRTLAQEAGIRLEDKPSPLWRLLVLANLVSARISADIAIAAARELTGAGATTPDGMLGLTWQQRVDALGRAHYVRYDESTATRLGECAERLRDHHGGDLRRLADEAGGDPRRLERDLQGFKGIGPTGAAIFCREAQQVWEWLRPYFDGVSRKGAERVGLPTAESELAGLVDGGELASFAAGLARVARDAGLAERVRRTAG
ncbi:hypothetical protein HDA32_004070 [Spinactinospora alkalitolerans]|uniref:Endonuclease n=1 Tax=Spinactinospora alkalitolerans TaxID=687207 RepID=A0A852U4S7_9ACTN|nr:endonuclease [Spinactinospora alkalitolerans]NYE48950.1 hypothetical protein [Spinactinospora alkalitolerans]